MISLPYQDTCYDIFSKKYSKGQEKSLSGDQQMDAVRRRNALSLSSLESDQGKWNKAFLKAQKLGLILAGRINSAAGTDLKATLINCFVQPVADSIDGDVDGVPGLYNALRESAVTLQAGGGVGYDFSSVRPMGAIVRSVDSTASGPLSFMHVFNESCKCIESAGARRGAMLAALDIAHPDILQFITAKRKPGVLTQFNMSVAVTDQFMDCLKNKKPFELVHDAEPGNEIKENGAYQRADGKWVYSVIDPAYLNKIIMDETYAHGDPGILFIDTINKQNNLYYQELISSSNPCGEQPLPAYGCCCLGSILTPLFVRTPFANSSPLDNFDWEAFTNVAQIGVRMLDNTLDKTFWPLEQQMQEAMSKRRIGLGLTGVGTTLVMLNLRYDSEQGRSFVAQMMKVLRDSAYRSSIELAKEKGPFPLFDKEKYLSGKFIHRLPDDIKRDIEAYGIRNSHLISLAPTGTISLTFGANCSGGIEPVFSFKMERAIRQSDGTLKSASLYDPAYLMYMEHIGLANGHEQQAEFELPDAFVAANDISPEAHLEMVAVCAPFVDSAISKTINCPEDIDRDRFDNLYIRAYELGLKGVTTFRPNSITGSVLSSESNTAKAPADLDTSADRRIKISKMPKAALASLRWPSRPDTPDGNPSITYMVNSSENPFAVFIGHVENGSHPFEVWVNGHEQPRLLAALAKSLSMDMRTLDGGWLELKLETLLKTKGSKPFPIRLPGQSTVNMSSSVSAFAALIKHRCNQLDALRPIETSPLVEALFALKEPKSGCDGTLSWTTDIYNPATGDDFALFIKELDLPDGTRRPYSLWLAGTYPEALSGLAKSLSLDMRVFDPAWIAKKLRSLSEFPEAIGDFLAKMPGSEKQETQASTVAYMAKLILHRYKMLGILDDQGKPVKNLGYFDSSDMPTDSVYKPIELHGELCPSCGAYAVVKYNGCRSCTACDYSHNCG